MEVSKVITEASCRIDYDNLCGGNDFAKLTNGYETCAISKLVWSVPDNVSRYFVNKAIFLKKKEETCEYEELEEVMDKEIKLQFQFDNLRRCSENLLNETEEDNERVNSEELIIKQLKPIFFDEEEEAKNYLKQMKKYTKNMEKVQFTAELVNTKKISNLSCHRDLYTILNSRGLYEPQESTWNKGLNKHLLPENQIVSLNKSNCTN